jgi:hypothetical protein
MLAALIRARELPVLSAGEWLILLHPALMILFVYPVVGATIRLGILVREKRLDLNPIAATVPAEHVDHGRWVTTGSVVAVILAVLALRVHDGVTVVTAPIFALIVGSLGGCLLLWRARRPTARASAAFLSWGALAWLVAPPPLVAPPVAAGAGPWERVWGDHGSSGVLLAGLLLFAMAAAPEIRSSPPWRRVHTGAAILTALLLAVQAISGSRDLLTLR